MSDLIDRQAAIDALHAGERVYTWDETCLEDRAKVYAPSEVIEALPATEPGIIYCKDCKFSSYEPDGKSADVYVCNYSRWRRSEGGLFPDDFCSRAEERENG